MPGVAGGGAGRHEIGAVATRDRRAALNGVGRRIAGVWWRLRTGVRAGFSRGYWWVRRRTSGLVRWLDDRTKAAYWRSRDLFTTVAWWTPARLRALRRWYEAGVSAGYLLYVTRTDRPLAPVARWATAMWRSSPVRRVRRWARTGWRSLAGVSGRAVRGGRVGLSVVERVRPRRRSLRPPIRAATTLLFHAVRSRVPVVHRRRTLRSRLSLPSPAPSARGRRWARRLSGVLAVGSFVALLAVDPAPLVPVALVAAGCCLAAVAYGRRFETECTGVQFSRRRETEVSIHTVDGDTVRLLLDPETDLDVELSRSAASVRHTIPEPNAGSVAE